MKSMKRLMAYICVPLVFTLLGYSVIYAVGSPLFSPFLSILQMISLKQPLDFQNDNLDSIFSEGMTQPTPDKTDDGEVLKASGITFPTFGTHYGELRIDGTSVKAPLYFGDSKVILKKGVGQYNGSFYPGCGGTIIIGGHNNTFFHNLDEAVVGKIVVLETNYGTYTYEVTETAVKKATDKTAYDLKATQENLVLYTCYPFDTLGLTPDRYYVYAKYVSGPKILLTE